MARILGPTTKNFPRSFTLEFTFAAGGRDTWAIHSGYSVQAGPERSVTVRVRSDLYDGDTPADEESE
ncbi:hypothetical protein SAMN04489841_4065 [Natrinema salaciae]|uniref:Uncharacterized protein n=1 Tax=Natrinema salaciae TaxID=1186196 RepID=A0A1H9Q281_9EURY|nr:hypothetical protein SAMN04489841_4065 [Natrinema salaciae]